MLKPRATGMGGADDPPPGLSSKQLYLLVIEIARAFLLYFFLPFTAFGATATGGTLTVEFVAVGPGMAVLPTPLL
jgi:hypothetical protein